MSLILLNMNLYNSLRLREDWERGRPARMSAEGAKKRLALRLVGRRDARTPGDERSHQFANRYSVQENASVRNLGFSRNCSDDEPAA